MPVKFGISRGANLTISINFDVPVQTVLAFELSLISLFSIFLLLSLFNDFSVWLIIKFSQTATLSKYKSSKLALYFLVFSLASISSIEVWTVSKSCQTSFIFYFLNFNCITSISSVAWAAWTKLLKRVSWPLSSPLRDNRELISDILRIIWTTLRMKAAYDAKSYKEKLYENK